MKFEKKKKIKENKIRACFLKLFFVFKNKKKQGKRREYEWFSLFFLVKKKLAT